MSEHRRRSPCCVDEAKRYLASAGVEWTERDLSELPGQLARIERDAEYDLRRAIEEAHE